MDRSHLLIQDIDENSCLKTCPAMSMANGPDISILFQLLKLYKWLEKLIFLRVSSKLTGETVFGVIA